ncbi:hypothetical protein F4859DRAFT_511098 [Xylaria cf. heliscus]|nr:hypothetical protein F4859DRAFT_511098 [Xylaria cf. heliscus]
MFVLKHLLPIALIGLAGARADEITGHDFDFSVQTYLRKNDSRNLLEPVLPGPAFSTSKPPTDVLSLPDLLSQEPKITLTNPNATAQYISFLVITSVSSITALSADGYEYTIPWLKTNQSVADDGTLLIDLAYFDEFTIATSEPLSTKIHVWQQTQAVFDYLTKGFSPESRVEALWMNDSSSSSSSSVDLPSLDFPRANVDFFARNETGLCRNNVAGNGDPVSVSSVVTSACTPAATSTASPSTTPSTSTGSGDGSENSASYATSPISAIGWTLMGAAFALFV